MTVKGVVLRRKGLIQKPRVLVETLSQDVSVAAGSSSTITFNIAQEVPRKVKYAGIQSITLPSGLYISAISVDGANKTLSITLHNPGTAAVSGTVTVTVVSVA